jgi:hypothetical protein
MWRNNQKRWSYFDGCVKANIFRFHDGEIHGCVVCCWQARHGVVGHDLDIIVDHPSRSEADEAGNVGPNSRALGWWGAWYMLAGLVGSGVDFGQDKVFDWTTG